MNDCVKGYIQFNAWILACVGFSRAGGRA